LTKALPPKVAVLVCIAIGLGMDISILKTDAFPRAVKGPDGTAAHLNARDERDFIRQAAVLRMEAQFLRDRARAMDAGIVQDAYFQIADRWMQLAAGLEMEALGRAADGGS
jgi:hypothetical protein